MLTLYAKLFRRLNLEIPYVVWKACHELPITLAGEGDIDLLVDLDYQERIQSILHEHGFVHASFNKLIFPFVKHYYGFDDESGRICHLHIYFKLITGESHLKSYHVPFENEFIKNRFLNVQNIYEASFSNQALIYSIRHQMKRASLLGLLFWAYEKKDYLKEYEYIKNGLISVCPDISQSENNIISSVFDFHRLDFSTGPSAYYLAKQATSSISEFRRFNAFKATWNSLRNISIRLLYKIFHVKKRLDSGLVIAISGVDGSGKTSMVKELHNWLGELFNVKTLHMGKPKPKCLTIAIRPMLFIYRSFFKKGENKTDIDSSGIYHLGSALKNKNCFFWGLRYLALAYERYKLSQIAHKLSQKGTIVICDRYPSLSPDKMDSPRIGNGGSRLMKIMKCYEFQLYRRVPKANNLIFLNVSVEEAMKRNRLRVKKDKEKDGEIAVRHNENKNLEFCSNQISSVDANHSYDSVLKSLKCLVWESLLCENNK